MRPTHLNVTNFMPFREMELDLSKLRLACLAGDNGHGKSAVIDAMTWALFGQARTRSADDLITLGEEQMEVRLEFQLGDAEYRVIRQRDSAGRGSSALEFQMRRNGGFVPLTASSIRDTQELIIDTIHMDYDLLTNSALLLQGQADKFSRQNPSERKRILGEILRLAAWDELEEKAKERSREAESRVTQIEGKAQGIAGELERIGDYEQELAAAELDVSWLSGKIEEAQGALDVAKEKAAGLSFKQQQLADVEGERQRRMHELDLLIRRISEGPEDLKQESTVRVLSYRRNLDEIKTLIGKVRPETLSDCERRLDQIRQNLEALESTGERREQVEAAISAGVAEKASLMATNDTLREAMKKLKGEIEILERAGATCPLCDGELTDEHRQEMLAQKQADGEAKAASFRENQETLKSWAEQLMRLRCDLAEIKGLVAKEKELRTDEAQFVEAVAAAKADQERLAEWKLQAEKIQETIEEERARYEAVKDERMAEWQTQADKLHAEISELLAKRDELSAELAGAEELTRKVQRLQAEISRVDLELSQATQRLGAAKQKLEHCEYLEQERERLEEQFEQAKAAKFTWDELRVACGKKGVQAMIIETVIPEIEEEANRLLQEMSDGRMSLSLESQRETKSGTVAETLEIHVSDELGTRSYDLFSGGEGFLIDLATRVAISEIMARRVGARLDMLVIDEGFGTQDARGLAKVVEAISSVSKLFGLTLVVTHIDALKEEFPARIDVVKGPAGSAVRVN